MLYWLSSHHSTMLRLLRHSLQLRAARGLVYRHVRVLSFFVFFLFVVVYLFVQKKFETSCFLLINLIIIVEILIKKGVSIKLLNLGVSELMIDLRH